MNRFSSVVAALGILVTSFSTGSAADKYWDVNGPTPGLFNTGGVFADGTWDTTSPNWSSSPAGTDPVAWVDPAPPGVDTAKFVTDGAADPNAPPDGVITVATGTRQALGLTFDSGWTAFSGSGGVNIGTGGVTVAANGIVTMEALTSPVVGAYTGSWTLGTNTINLNPGALFSVNRISVTNNIAFTGTTGGIVLNGGTYRNTSTTVGDSFFPAAGNITIGAAGIGYLNVPTPGQSGNIYTPASGVGIKGMAGATVDNGGSGTIVKTGSGELRIGAAGSFTFAKLVVDGTGIQYTGTTTATSNAGEYRIGNATNENFLGAIPLAPLADAITLQNGGMLGSSQVGITVHPNRGVVIGTGGGGSWGTGGGNLFFAGVVSGSGPLIIQGASGGGGLGFNNPNNTWFGDLVMRNGFLILNQSLSATHIEGENQAGATLFGTVNIAPGKSLTVGSDNQSTQFDGRVTGAQGTFNKVGSGILTLDTYAVAGEWTNLGTMNLNGGGIKFDVGGSGTAPFNNAGFGSFTTVNLAAGTSLDMNAIPDQMGGLNGAGDIINHNAAVNNATNDTSNLNIRGFGTYNLSGTIGGSGEVIKNGLGTQTFSAAGGNSYAGGTRVYSGRLNVTNSSGSGTGAGPIQIGTTGTFAAINLDSTSTLGGTGFIDGAVTVQLGGNLTGGTGSAPTNAVLTANSTVDIQSGGALAALLGAPGSSDRVKVLTANGLTTNAGGLLTLNGASSAINGTYTVLDYNGYAAGTAATLDLNNATGFEMSGGLTDTGTAVQVTMTNTVQNRAWTFDGSGNWSAAAADATNWAGGAGGQVNGPGSVANFNATATPTSRTVTMTDSNKIVGTLNFNDAAGGNYTIASNINAYRLVMDTYTGDAAINLTAGSHTIAASMDTKKNTVVTNNGNTLTLSGGVYNKAGLVNSGSGTLALTASAATQQIVNNADLTNSGNGSVTITMSATGGFSNNATGRLLNSGTGNFTITNNGAANTNLINTGTFENSGSGTFTVNGTIGLTGAVTTNDTVQTAGSIGNYVNSGSGTFNTSIAMAAAAGIRFSNSLTGSMTINNPITGTIGLGDSGNVYIDGPGTVVLSNVAGAPSTYTGRTILKQGKLEIKRDDPTNVNTTALQRNLGGAPTITGGNYDNITFDGGTLRTTASVVNTIDNAATPAPLVLNDLVINTNRGMYFKGNGTIEVANDPGVRTTFAGRIHGAGNMTKTGSGTLTLTGESITYDGNISVNEGVLAVTAAKSLGTTVGNTTVASGASLNTSGTAAITEVLTLNGTGIANDGALHHTANNKTLSGAITLGSSGVRINGDANTLTLSGAISGAGNPNLTLGGAGTITVSTGGINLGTGSLTKDGAGTVNLTRAAGNTMGSSLISGGQLNANNTSGSALGSGPVAVTGGTLGGTGSVTGAVSVNAGGTISPGTNATINKLGTGALTMNTGSYAAELNSTVALASAMDLINANGALSILAGSTLSLTDLAATSTALAPGTKFSLISYSGAWDGGIFNGLPDDTGTITAGANTFKINYNDTTGGANFTGGLYTNFVTLSVPSAGITGDYNNNGTVDAGDYVLWRKTPASYGGDPAGYTTWRSNCGSPPGAGAGSGLGTEAVPEPTSIVLVLFGIAFVAAGRRRTR